MNKKIRRWIVRKCGGVLWVDLSYRVQQLALNEAAKKTADYWAKSILDHGFTVSSKE